MTNAQTEQPKAFAFLAQFVGSTWKGEIGAGEKKVLVEAKWEWGPNKKVIRVLSKIGMNLDSMVESESLYMWSDKEKKLFYMDMHGDGGAYSGAGDMVDGALVIDFASVVDKTHEYRVRVSLKDASTMRTEIMGKKDGKWSTMIDYDRKKQP